MPLQVHHYYPYLSQNSGDALVARALRSAFVRHFGPAEFVDFPATTRYQEGDRPIGLCRANVQRSNREADVVVVGGSNLLEPCKQRERRQANLPLVIDGEALRTLRTPTLLVGMGTGSSFGEGIAAYSAGAREAIRLLHERSLGFAVRDVTTAGRLADIGVSSVCTGCPVTFLTDRPIRAVKEQGPLLVSLPPTRILKRFLGPAFMGLAMKFVGWLQGQGVPVVVTLHERCDREHARRLVPSGIDIFYTESVDELIARFEESIGVVGFRLHAGLLGMGLGKPIIAAGVDWRGLAAIETFGFQDLAVRPFRLGQLAKLKRLAGRLLARDAAFSARQQQAKEHFRGRHEEFFRQAVRRFSGRARAG
jgi:hypothetical protein